jgi:hypothetical protein
MEADILTRGMLEERLFNFARCHPEIVSIRRGCDPEEGFLTYYFMTRGKKHRFELDDELSRMDIALAQRTSSPYHISMWPETSKPLPFLGDIIWCRAPT